MAKLGTPPQEQARVKEAFGRVSILPAARQTAPIEKSTGSSPVESAPARPVRDGIAIIYSHPDEKWRQELTKMLRPVSDRLKIWDDTKIRPGEEWQAEIEKALASVKAAVLLVTPDFLNSYFIVKNELPLLEAAQKEGCRIIWINVKNSVVEDTSIGQYQALYNKLPLDSLTQRERNAALAQIAEQIWEVAQS